MTNVPSVESMLGIEPTYSTVDVAEMLGISRQAIHKYIAEGKVKATGQGRPGDPYKISASQVELIRSWVKHPFNKRVRSKAA